MGYLYKITFAANGKAYIGITSKNVPSRLEKHVAPSNKLLIGRAFKKYGRDNVNIEILAEHSDFSELQKMEIAAIAEHRTKNPNGYNLTDGGEGALGYMPSEAARRRMSVVTTNSMKDPAVRKKIADSVSRHFSKPGERERQAERLRGKKQSDKTKAKISLALKGRVTSETTREKISAAHKARTPKILKVCEHCQSPYSIKPSHATDSKFCSSKCGHEHKIKRVEKQCARCGTSISVRRSSAKDKNYCSIQCSLTSRVVSDETRAKLSAAQSKKITKICKKCGVEFYVKPSHADRRFYCSKVCYHKASSKHVDKKCARCGVAISVRGNNIRDKNYCSKKCSMSMRRALDGSGRITGDTHETNRTLNAAALMERIKL